MLIWLWLAYVNRIAELGILETAKAESELYCSRIGLSLHTVVSNEGQLKGNIPLSALGHQ